VPQIARAWLPDHDLTGVERDYGLTNFDPICDGDPPLPDPPPQWPRAPRRRPLALKQTLPGNQKLW